MKSILTIALMMALTLSVVTAQDVSDKDLPAKMEELTAPQFSQAVEKSAKTCIIPLGVLEKHGPQLPLGTDVMMAREIAKRAAQTEYTIIFPYFYFGQIFEAKHQPGTLAYSNDLIWNVLQETCDELARNGIEKIILVNGHGGNNDFLPYFCQSQLAKAKDYSVILFQPRTSSEVQEKAEELRQTDIDMHAGENETSMLHSFNPDLVHPEAANSETGEDQERLTDLPYGYTGIWWYGRFPQHYAGDGSQPSDELGELLLNHRAEQLVELIRYLKEDDSIENLQQEFFDRTEH
ncbi:MAG: creatininase family protein [Marinilabilia sp.]